MPEYLSPGVYVEEVDRGPKPIEGVGTAMATFIGFTEKAELLREVGGEMLVENLINKPQLVTNWSQYVERYGNFVSGTYLPQSVYGYFMNGGSRCYVVSVRTFPKAQTVLMNRQGKPALTAVARLSGPIGSKLRVRIEDVEALPAPKKGEKGEGEGKGAEGAEGDLANLKNTFTLIVEEEKSNNEWKVAEVFNDVKLQETAANGKKTV